MAMMNDGMKGQTRVYVSGNTYVWEVQGTRVEDCIEEIQRNGCSVHDEYTKEMFQMRFGCTATVREETPLEFAERHSRDKIKYLSCLYGRYYKAWKDKKDDRGLFCVIYDKLIEATECMAKVGNNTIWVAFNDYFAQEEAEHLKEIVHRFTLGCCARANLTDD